jgi:hypothetical protein
MDSILSELDNVITSLEDRGLLKQADAVQGIFVRISNELKDLNVDRSFEDADQNEIDHKNYLKMLEDLNPIVPNPDEDKVDDSLAFEPQVKQYKFEEEKPVFKIKRIK